MSHICSIVQCWGRVFFTVWLGYIIQYYYNIFSEVSYFVFLFFTFLLFLNMMFNYCSLLHFLKPEHYVVAISWSVDNAVRINVFYRDVLYDVICQGSCFQKFGTCVCCLLLFLCALPWFLWGFQLILMGGRHSYAGLNAFLHQPPDVTRWLYPVFVHVDSWMQSSVYAGPLMPVPTLFLSQEYAQFRNI